MCDYSLEHYAGRPAQESEIYVTTRFPSGSIGFASPGDCMTAVCVAHGSKMTLENLPPELQKEFGVGPIETVDFVRLEGDLHHDGLRFANGRTVFLFRLGAGVLGNLTGEPERVAEPAQALLVEPAE
jgi:hypothetical protein